MNFFDFQNLLRLILVDMQYELNGTNFSVKTFAKIIATINSIVVARFLGATYCIIFKHLLTADHQDGRFFDLVPIDFGIKEINN